ncbi:MAG: FtsX-like permease family protein [Candidatus Moraniibacteriota bacterium]|nr:MAG: FtsX-like permease family protein [Candidatus Moranbacteria bacterium]
MKVTILAKSAFISIARNKLRSFLTTLGVVIGVLSVILLTSIGNGLTVFVEQQFANLGSNLLIISPGEIVGEDGGFNQEAAALSLTTSKLSIIDANALERAGYPLGDVAVVIEGGVDVRTPQGKRQGFSVATTPEYSTLRNTKTTKGRFFSESDVSSSRKVAVIGSKIAEKLFVGVEPVGQEVTLNRVRFEVIGVAEPKSSGSFGGPDIDSSVYIPYTTARSALGQEKISYILVQAMDKQQIERAKDRIKVIMGKRLNEEDFSVTDQREILKTIQTILGTLTVGLAGIAAISLVVGGIGIMNIMLVAVSERTREIGLRKALGATPKSILIQFLIESAVLSTLGGVIGILLGILGALGLRAFFPATPALNSILLAFGVSLLTGIVFGVFPARKAASLNPIEALRYE